MTKLPHPDWNVQGVEGPKYRVGPECAVADCAHWADHGHHLWRRSFLIGDWQWVELWDGTVVQNVVALCFMHHELITVDKAEIHYDETNFRYRETNEHDNSWKTDVVLVPQPKKLDSFRRAVELTGEVSADDIVRRSEEEPACPTCGHKKRHANLPAGEKRNRVTWPVHVPVDERENGAEVLDTLELECAKILGREDHASHKYYVLAEVMADWITSRVHVEDFGIGG